MFFLVYFLLIVFLFLFLLFPYFFIFFFLVLSYVFSTFIILMISKKCWLLNYMELMNVQMYGALLRSVT